MPLTLDALRRRLGESAGATFAVTGDELGAGPLASLFSTYLPSATLTVAGARPEAAELRVSGTTTVGDARDVPVTARFTADAAGTGVDGIDVTVELPGWTLDAPFVAWNGAALRAFGLASPRLLLSASATQLPAASLAAELPVRGSGDAPQPQTLWAVIPADARAGMGGEPRTLTFAAEVEGVTLPSLGAAAQWIAGADFAAAVGDAIPLAPTLRLKAVELVLHPTLNEIRAFRVVVSSAVELKLVEGHFEISEVFLSLFVSSPGKGTRVSAVLGATLDVHGIRMDVSAAFPELFLRATLSQDTPVLLKPFVSNFLPAARVPDGLRISDLDFGVGVRAPHPWVLEVGVEDVWSIPVAGRTLDLTRVSAWMQSQGAAAPAVTMVAELEVAGVPLYVRAEHPQGGGWKFAGGTEGPQRIDFTGVARDLGARFGVDTLPDLAEMEIARLDVSFDTDTRAFTFGCAGTFLLGGTSLGLELDVDLAPKGAAAGPDDTFSAAVHGTLRVKTASGTVEFAVDVTHNAGLTTIAGALKSEDTPVGVNTLARALGFDPAIPDEIDVELQDLSVAWRARTVDGKRTQTFAVFASSAKWGDALLAMQTDGGAAGAAWVLGIHPKLEGSLSDLPVVGAQLPAGLVVAVKDFQIVAATRPLPAAEVAALNAAAAALLQRFPSRKPWAFQAGELPGGLGLSVGLVLGEETRTLAFAVAARGAAPSPPPAPAPRPDALPAPNAPTRADAPPLPVPAGGGDAAWFSLQRTVGPLFLGRVGLRYQGGTLWFLLDASLSAGGATLSLMGLAAGSPLNAFTPRFGLDGIGVAYASPPVTIMGALLAAPGGGVGAGQAEFRYDGVAVVKAGRLGLSAFASYAQLEGGRPSMFVFGSIDGAFGGHPAFFVTGFAGGFGFNRALELPGHDEVGDFPLLAVSRPAPPGQKPDPMRVLAVMEGREAGASGRKKEWIRAAAGRYWLAAGIRFSTFGLLDTRALAVAVVGADEFQLALLGTSTVRLPREGPRVFACLELQVAAVVKPLEGFLGISAVVGRSSYLIHPSCRLTGGFAFSLWFAGPHAGDFAVTAGGYHPRFDVPAHYPRVDRVGYNWTVSTQVTVKGGAYFALTPSSAMAGIGLEVLYQAGGVRAWITAAADFLIAWKPFFYSARIAVSVGVSYRLGGEASGAISVEVGASLELWGPPTGGEATVDLFIFSFTVAFGEPRSTASDVPLEWKDFRSLLPAGGSVVTVRATGGLQAGGPPAEAARAAASAGPAAAALAGAGGATPAAPAPWVVRADEFSFAAESAIPSSAFASGTGDGVPLRPEGPLQAAAPIDIRPMNLPSVESRLVVELLRDGAAHPEELSAWRVEALARRLPESLWGAPLRDAAGRFVQRPAQPSARTVEARAGLAVAVPPATRGPTPGPVAPGRLAAEELRPAGVLPLAPGAAPTAAGLPALAADTLAALGSIAGGEAAGRRAALARALHDAAVFEAADGSVARLGECAGHLYADAPMRAT